MRDDAEAVPRDDDVPPEEDGRGDRGGGEREGEPAAPGGDRRAHARRRDGKWRCDRACIGASRRGWLRDDGRGRLEGRRVAALVDADHDRVEASGAFVVLRQLGPEPARLDAHDRVEPRIVVGGAVEHLRPEQVLLQLVAFAGQRPLDDEPQKAAQAVRVDEPRAGQNPIQLRADGVRGRRGGHGDSIGANGARKPAGFAASHRDITPPRALSDPSRWNTLRRAQVPGRLSLAPGRASRGRGGVRVHVASRRPGGGARRPAGRAARCQSHRAAPGGPGPGRRQPGRRHRAGARWPLPRHADADRLAGGPRHRLRRHASGLRAAGADARLPVRARRDGALHQCAAARAAASGNPPRAWPSRRPASCRRRTTSPTRTRRRSTRR